MLEANFEPYAHQVKKCQMGNHAHPVKECQMGNHAHQVKECQMGSQNQLQNAQQDNHKES